MSDYKKMYFKLFHAVTDTIQVLQKAQQEAEEIFLESKGGATCLLQQTAKRPRLKK